MRQVVTARVTDGAASETARVKAFFLIELSENRRSELAAGLVKEISSCPAAERDDWTEVILLAEAHGVISFREMIYLVDKVVDGMLAEPLELDEPIECSMLSPFGVLFVRELVTRGAWYHRHGCRDLGKRAARDDRRLRELSYEGWKSLVGERHPELQRSTIIL